MKRAWKICIIVAVAVLSGVGICAGTFLIIDLTSKDTNEIRLQKVEAAFNGFAELNAIDMTMELQLIADSTSSGKLAGTYTATSGQARIVAKDYGTRQVGYYDMETAQGKLGSGKNPITSESYYYNGYEYYRKGFSQTVEKIGDWNLEDYDADINSIINMSELEKIEPKVKKHSDRYSITLTDVPLKKIIKNTNNLKIGNGDYVMNVWLDKKTKTIKTLDYTASFIIKRVQHRNPLYPMMDSWNRYVYIDTSYEMYLKMDIDKVNDDVEDINVPDFIKHEIEVLKELENDNDVVSLEDDKYRYTINKNSYDFIVYAKGTNQIVHIESYNIQPSCLDVSGSLIAVGFGDRQTLSQGNGFAYYTRDDWENGKFVEAEYPLENIIVYKNKIFFSGQYSDSGCYIFSYDLVRKSSVKIALMESMSYWVNRENGILYIGERSSEDNRLLYINLNNEAILFQNGFMDLGHYKTISIYYDGQYVYYAGKKFNKFSGQVI